MNAPMTSLTPSSTDLEALSAEAKAAYEALSSCADRGGPYPEIVLTNSAFTNACFAVFKAGGVLVPAPEAGEVVAHQLYWPSGLTAGYSERDIGPSLRGAGWTSRPLYAAPPAAVAAQSATRGEVIEECAWALADLAAAAETEDGEVYILTQAIKRIKALASAPSSAPGGWQPIRSGDEWPGPCLGWSPYTGIVVVNGPGPWQSLTFSMPLPAPPLAPASRTGGA